MRFAQRGPGVWIGLPPFNRLAEGAKRRLIAAQRRIGPPEHGPPLWIVRLVLQAVGEILGQPDHFLGRLLVHRHALRHAFRMGLVRHSRRAEMEVKRQRPQWYDDQRQDTGDPRAF